MGAAQHLVDHLGRHGAGLARLVGVVGLHVADHDLLALEVAGIPGAALYPGSWSEWVRDADRPVATGHEPGPAAH